MSFSDEAVIFAHAMVSGERTIMTAEEDLGVCMSLRTLPKDEGDMSDK
jgi:hypothetical protein